MRILRISEELMRRICWKYFLEKELLHLHTDLELLISRNWKYIFVIELNLGEDCWDAIW